MFKKLGGFSVVILLLGVGLAAFSFAAYHYFNKGQSEISKEETKIEGNRVEEQEKRDIPFFEMTIPGLRERGYESEITRMDQRSTNPSYTTYFATYTSENLNINGMLTKPTGEMPVGGWPAIVFIHGYIPPTLYNTMSNYNSYVDYLAKQGFVVFKIDLRGHDDSQGLAHGAYYSGDYIVDALSAKAALESTEFVKDGAVGLWGHSMAGNVVFRALVASQVKAAVIWAGAVYTYEDWEYGINDNSYRPPVDDSERAKRRQLLFDTHGEFDKNSEFWKMVPATNYLDGVKGSMQIHHAVDDNVVAIEYSRNLVKILSGSSVSAELFEYSSGGHNMTGSTFNTAMQRTAEFFREKLN